MYQQHLGLNASQGFSAQRWDQSRLENQDINYHLFVLTMCYIKLYQHRLIKSHNDLTW